MPRLAFLPVALVAICLLALVAVWVIGALGLGVYAPARPDILA